MSIKIEELSIKRNNELIINNLKFEMNPSEITALIAPNGSGKTTLFNEIAHLIDCSYSLLVLNNFNYKEASKYNSSLFFIESSNHLYEDLSPTEHLKLIKNLWKSTKSIEEVLTYLKMEKYKNKAVKKLSLGMKQHLLIAMYIISDAPVFLFDEPLNGLDPSSIKLVNQILRNYNEKKTIMISSHDLFNIREVCNRAVFLKNGEISEDTRDLDKLDSIYTNLFEKDEYYGD